MRGKDIHHGPQMIPLEQLSIALSDLNKEDSLALARLVYRFFENEESMEGILIRRNFSSEIILDAAPLPLLKEIRNMINITN